MERLNDILNRAMQRRQHIPEQTERSERYSVQGSSPHESEGQRQRVPPPPSRSVPPLREQRARLGQPNPYGAPAQNGQTLTRRYSTPGQQSQGELHQRGTRPQSAPTSRPMYSRVPPDAPSSSQQRQRPLQEPAERRPRPANPHYATDDHQPLPRADVLEDWEEDDGEMASMQYDDWELSRDEVSSYQRINVQPDSHPKANSTFARRDMPRIPDSEMPRRLTRNLRDMRMPTPPPAPQTQARAHEAQHYHRRTQPLNPQAISEMQAEASASHGQQLPRPQIVVREQVLSYAPVEVPPPLPTQHVCPICKGAGYLRLNVAVGHPQFGKPVACECKEEERREKRRQQLLELSDLSAFRNRSFNNFNTRFQGVHPSVQQAFQEAYTFAQNPKGWLILIGPNGCGKTHLAAAIANQSLSDGAVVLFTVVPDLLANLRATFASTATEAYEERFAKMREAELLVLDDLGAHQSSAWANEKLFQLLNYRYNSCYPTVITANKQGLSSIDERIQSRLSDTALAITIVMTGAIDYRRQNPRRDL
ncbi:MAG TPA: ATP-binding protein [Ktedonobacteraceae bacterium]|nr:ATP-binding protein [Ktedonobacteraceae bacterium]